MVSDFFDEKNGYLALTDQEFDAAMVNHPNLEKRALSMIEY